MASYQAIVTTESHTRPQLFESTNLTGSLIDGNRLHSVIAVESIITAEKYLLSFFTSESTLSDLLLQMPEDIFRSRTVETILKSALRQKRRFAPLHDAISQFVSRFLLKSFTTGFIKPQEQTFISCGTIGVRLSRTVATAAGTKKPQAWTKFPDAAILYGSLNSVPIPSVVFEVGFSESYNDLLNDAKQWLSRSSTVRLVILVDITEDVRIRRGRQDTDEVKKRIKDLLVKFGTTIAREKEGIELDDCETLSTPDLYDEIQSQIVAEDWVGPIQATLEQWTMENDALKLRSRIIVLPEQLDSLNPTITIGDIIPKAERYLFKDFDDSRSTELDMDDYRELLRGATVHLARQRALSRIRQKQNNGDDEYVG
ncbi:hypothetical protein DTO027B5_3288 [Paecilomyces variotii]|nr:hypothetical protein DTO027B3_3985 [Paecilomyces variotii]KAJ9334782.1 hypothetical protein DTO027B5_3288 [Paecilomyces variotii]